MSNNYTLQYRTFDTLMADVNSDLPKYHLGDHIQPHQLIKIANKVSYDLGLRIYQTKQVLLELDKGRVRLPSDFYVLNYAFMCSEYTTQVYQPQGTQIEERPLTPQVPNYQQWPTEPVDLCAAPAEDLDPNCPCDQATPCDTGTVYTDCKGNDFELVQILKSEKRTYKTFYPLRLRDFSGDVDCDCPNMHMNTKNEFWIRDGWLYTSLNKGNIYLNYQGSLINKDGEILVVDHPLINEYYEYALKERILENLALNNVPVSDRAIQLVDRGLHKARMAAKSLVNMPGYNELRKMYEVNRKSQYSKYYDMFAGLSWSAWDGAHYDRTRFIRQ